MSLLRFNVGISFDTSGPFRTTYRRDGWYVVGGGWLIPVASYEEAMREVERMKGREITVEEKA